MSSSEPLLRVEGIRKQFPGVLALADVSFELHHGEVLTLAGENGAGKSTFLRILSGSLRPDRGRLSIEGTVRSEYTPESARRDGIVIAHQEPAIVPQLTVEQNILIGLGRAARRAASGAVSAAMSDVRRMGFAFGADRPMRTLSPAERHALTIARAFAFGARIVALDEPTTAMVEQNATAVIERVRQLAHEKNIGILFVSHKMNEVMRISDRVVVLRDGRASFDERITNTTSRDIVRAMVGRELLDYQRPKRDLEGSAVLLSVDDATHPKGVGPVSFAVRGGEVVGISGLVGSGRTELLRAIVHADPRTEAKVGIAGRVRRIRSPEDAKRAGIAFIPEDRKNQGLVLLTSAYENFALPNGAMMGSRMGTVSPRKQVAAATKLSASVDLKPRNVRAKARDFSGGNQQKIVLGKWLTTNARVFLFDEPTKGVDVGGRAEIYALIDDLTRQGCAVVVVSSDMPEIIALSDRALVMREGRVVDEFSGNDITEQNLVAAAVGVDDDAA
ncbi:ribose transport system ATP-binding protein [Actinomyces ruminicola]|uniref:Ribose transport system ATP-binding protein n=1 Tax=Actinomyces ruminicola TaxID=332524 RepID=A0A1H0BZX0_9ACTO|nr:sugar ABC transporter ATP-binding protein [Actinomyces ruminicola]SDN51231.1 ribose transport system ATP-binding protein [Actinomyces ruminicola]